MENNSDTKIDNIATSNKSINSDKIDEEYTPKLFSDEQSQKIQMEIFTKVTIQINFLIMIMLKRKTSRSLLS